MAPRTPIRLRVAVALAAATLVGLLLNILMTSVLLRGVRGESDLARVNQGATNQVVVASGSDAALAEGTHRIRVRASLGPRQRALVTAYLVLNALVAFVLGMFLLDRALSHPFDRLAAAANRIGRLELDDPFEGRPSLLGPLGLAFERMAANLKAERARVQSQISELERLNLQLSEARDSLVRSEKLATVGRLAAGIAHEVGNPLGAILGYLEIARDKSPAADEYLTAIDHEVMRIDRTVRELLDFSRPSDSAELRPVNLRQAVESAVRLASLQKRLRNVAFAVDLGPSLSIWAEPHHLSQVLVNVLLNAGDAMQSGGRIEIRSAPGADVPPGRRASDPPAGPRIELSISDTGPGIPDQNLPRIFDPFFTTKEPGAGTGLGLAICHRILETFGGEIHAANRAEGGAVFTLVLRLAQESASPG
jgi:signal transduction histidine kinase